MPARGFVVINENHEQYKKVKRAVLIGILIILAIIGWHVYHNSSKKVAVNEMSELSQQLYALELQNKPYNVHINLQCKIPKSKTPVDCSEKPLFDENTDISQDENSTIELLKKLYKFYNYNVFETEQVTPQKVQQELDFLNAILKTPTMMQTMKFLGKKGFKVDNHEGQLRLLQDVWFTPYSRAKGPEGSTGFEHVFLAEIRNNQTLGFHNWVYFLEQEKEGYVNYYGYIEHIDMGKHNLHGLSLRMDFHDKKKEFNAILIGSSPELELSLYTVCFLLNAQKPCYIELGTNKFSIMTYIIFNANQKKTLGSAFITLED